MYKITKRDTHIKEDLQLCHADGTPALILHVNLDMDIVGTQLQNSFERLGIAQVALGKDPATAENYGQAVIAFFNVIFGEDGCKQLLEFYQDNYTEMLLDIYPFLSTEILPKIREYSEDRKRQLLAAVKEQKSRAAGSVIKWPF